MRVPRVAAVAALALGAAGAACAQTAGYDGRNLTIPSVQVGSTVYSNVILRLNSFEILAVGQATPASAQPPAATCSEANFTTERFDAISVGMTLDQVAATIGCGNNFSLTKRVAGLQTVYVWGGAPRMILVDFDAAGAVVKPFRQGASFKLASGF